MLAAERGRARADRQTFIWKFDENGLGYGWRHASPFTSARLDGYPPRIRDFLENGVKSYLQRRYVVNNIYSIQLQPYIYNEFMPEIYEQIDRMAARIVIYMHLLPDGTIRYGYDEIDEEDS